MLVNSSLHFKLFGDHFGWTTLHTAATPIAKVLVFEDLYLGLELVDLPSEGLYLTLLGVGLFGCLPAFYCSSSTRSMSVVLGKSQTSVGSGLSLERTRVV